jgi:hypothetical protein
MSLTLCINPIYLMMTCAISCSYAFMLPVATAPNAIVFSHSTMKTSGNNFYFVLVGFGRATRPSAARTRLFRLIELPFIASLLLC